MIIINSNNGHCGSVVGSVPCVWKVADLNSTLASTLGPWASPSLAVTCSARRFGVLTLMQYQCCSQVHL